MAFTGVIYSGTGNRGVDRKITLKRNDTGAQIQLGGRLASIEWSSKDETEEVPGIDNGGRVDHIWYPGGISGSISVSRYNGDYETFEKFMNANFYAGGTPILGTIVMETYNPFDGTTNTDTLTLVVFGKLKSGPFESKRNAKVSLSFEAQERV